MFKKLVQMGIQKAIGKGKVSPTIKSVKPTKDIAGSVKRVYRDEYSKRIDATNKSKKKIDTGKKMMREGQKELRKMVDTKKAFKFKFGTTKEKTFPIEPGRNPKKQYKGLVEESKPQKKFKKGKELDKKATGGRVGRKFGSPNPRKTNVQKIKETFAPKKKLSPKQMKIAKLAGNKNKIDAADFKKLRGKA